MGENMSLVLKLLQNTEDLEDYIQFIDTKQMVGRFLEYIHIIMIGYGF